ncbi:hypothetical protein N2152v2_003188 [Parachlorella kessleri]
MELVTSSAASEDSGRETEDALQHNRQQQQEPQQQHFHQLLQQQQQQRERRRKGAQKQPAQEQQQQLVVHQGASQGKPGSLKGGSSLLERMRQRLQGGRFRWLNEKLYTCEGSDALALMQQQPDLYEQYHEGFREQTKGWPVQPVEVAIRWLAQKPPSWAVADLGCGDAQLARSVPQRVRSFDLVATAPGVEAANLAALPLGTSCLDAAVFCLSLMGTDYGLFLEEAARVLKPGGWLWIAEVQSRFVDEAGRSVVDTFVAAVKGLGFELKQKDLKNPFFLTFQFQKQQQQQQQQEDEGCRQQLGKHMKHAKQQQQQHQREWPPLRACQYKKR